MSTVHEPPDASKPVIVADACAYRYQNGGICGCTAADLIHAVVGSAAYESLSTRQRSVLFDEIGGVHPFASTATEPPSSPTPTSAPQPAEVPTAQPFMSAEGGSSAGQARQETRDTITLLPCPFCGAQPTSRAYSTGVPGMEDWDGWSPVVRPDAVWRTLTVTMRRRRRRSGMRASILASPFTTTRIQPRPAMSRDASTSPDARAKARSR